jgi:hypothetical protein
MASSIKKNKKLARHGKASGFALLFPTYELAAGAIRE